MTSSSVTLSSTIRSALVDMGPKKDKNAAASSRDRKEDCNECKKKVTENENGLQCESCEEWYHTKCLKVPDDVYVFLMGNRNFHWLCSNCDGNSGKLYKEVGELRQQLVAMREMMNRMETEISNMKGGTQLLIETEFEKKLAEDVEKKVADKVQEKVNLIKDDVTFADAVAKHVENKFVTVTSELTEVQHKLNETKENADDLADRASRANNVIIYRVEEVSADTREERIRKENEFILRLANEVLGLGIRESDVKSVFRLGKREESKSRPLMIQFREGVTKNRFMESLAKLKSAGAEFRNISVSHDMTIKDRNECKKLVEEAKAKSADSQGNFVWRVRGLPGQMKLVRLRKS